MNTPFGPLGDHSVPVLSAFGASFDASRNRLSADLASPLHSVDHGDKGGTADGMETDSKNRLYLTNYEHNAILRRLPDGTYETLAHDPHLLWPDTLSVAADGYLYCIANPLRRQA